MLRDAASKGLQTLFNFLGVMPINNFTNDIKNLTLEKKSIISKLGIRIGAKFFFMPNLLKKSLLSYVVNL